MNGLFNPDVIRSEITNLAADRERIDNAIRALQAALHSVERLEQREFQLQDNGMRPETTLYDAVKRAAIGMSDGITRQRVIREIERSMPSLRPKSASVAASLINLTKGEEPMLKVAIEGRGRSPAYYSTQGTTTHRLSADEIETLLDDASTRGTGGWQSFWLSLQRSFDKASGTITLTPELRARIYQYYHAYGQGGWQSKIMKVFRRELPQLFVA